jgi:hypothetical protein
MTQVLLCGAVIVTLSMGIRHGFGLWLAPTTMDRGWTRETFAFAIARRIVLHTTALAALAAVFAACFNPHLLVDLATRVWSCF